MIEKVFVRKLSCALIHWILEPSSHPPSIVNIVNGQMADDRVNVHEAVNIGTKQMKEYEKGIL